DEAELPDDAAVRAHFRGGGHGLLGTPRAEAEGLGRSAREALRTAAPLRSGSHPAACLDTVTAGASGPLVVARVESVRYRGAPALAYVLVGASPGADALDRVEAWIVDPRSCSTRLFQALD
ncbi:MAG: hypothetical protein M3276_08845, partial [Actinomycetota bacterium]|nr:hypothetical protein [Actinomycetota bacterium]